MISFFAALHFLTIVPPVVQRTFRMDELGRSVASYPLVGLLIGALLLGLSWLLSNIFPPWIVAGLVLVVWVLASGGIHMDGVMDAADGLFGGRTADQRLTIMHDERVGAFGVLAAVFVLFLKLAALAEGASGFPSLLLAPVVGRWTMSMAIVAFPYARKEGLGSAMKNEARGMYLWVSTLFCVVIAYLSAGVPGLMAMGPAAFLLVLVGRFVVGRVGGFTGDIYGATNELVELFVLLSFSVSI
ncbi:MAG: adenosylcobinamide-GDP ribazoletransferase [Chloroflexi bacterium]|nr:adenosylcobinamide-GDP ribazoletransferase [Chloroflexota bacterium]